MIVVYLIQCWSLGPKMSQILTFFSRLLKLFKLFIKQHAYFQNTIKVIQNHHPELSFYPSLFSLLSLPHLLDVWSKGLFHGHFIFSIYTHFLSMSCSIMALNAICKLMAPKFITAAQTSAWIPDISTGCLTSLSNLKGLKLTSSISLLPKLLLFFSGNPVFAGAQTKNTVVIINTFIFLAYYICFISNSC